jgi:hypothetical protein
MEALSKNLNTKHCPINTAIPTLRNLTWHFGFLVDWNAVSAKNMLRQEKGNAKSHAAGTTPALRPIPNSEPAIRTLISSKRLSRSPHDLS